MSAPEPWYIYIILCKDNTLYTGITKDLTRRFQEHAEQDKKCAKYLRGKAPLQLVFSHILNDKSKALRAEHFIKKLPKGTKDRLIKGELVLNLNDIEGLDLLCKQSYL